MFSWLLKQTDLLRNFWGSHGPVSSVSSSEWKVSIPHQAGKSRFSEITLHFLSPKALMTLINLTGDWHTGHTNQCLQSPCGVWRNIPRLGNSYNETSHKKSKFRKTTPQTCETTSINLFLTFYAVFTELGENAVLCKDKPAVSLCRTGVHVCGVIFKPQMRSLKRNPAVTVTKWHITGTSSVLCWTWELKSYEILPIN